MQELISIIIPIYNASKYLHECLDSIINQTYDNLEIILINDGSIDNSKDICEEYTKNNKRIKLYNQKNSGPSKARNKGLSLAKGKYIIFIDADDYIELDMIEKMYALAQIKDLDLVICSYNEIMDNDVIKKNIETKELFQDYLYGTEAGGYSWNKLVKRECIKENFDEKLYIMEDLVFWNDNSKYINKIGLINEPLYNYRIISNSLVHNKSINKKFISSLDACNILIDSIDEKHKKYYRLIYIHNYLYVRKYLKKNKNSFIQKYKKNYQKCLKDILKDRSVSRIKKIKILLKSRFNMFV